jgi:hypothetical protein
MLRVHLKYGRSLIASDYGGTSDPYVILRVGDAKWKSKTINRTLDPNWDELASFDAAGEQNVLWLVAEVWDNDLARPDDPLGLALLPLLHLKSGATIEVPLGRTSSKDEAGGLLGLSVEFTDGGAAQTSKDEAAFAAACTKLCNAAEPELAIGMCASGAERLEACVPGVVYELCPNGTQHSGTLFVSNVRMLLLADKDADADTSTTEPDAPCALGLGRRSACFALQALLRVQSIVAGRESSRGRANSQASERRGEPGSGGGVSLQMMPCQAVSIFFDRSAHGAALATQLQTRLSYALANTERACMHLLSPRTSPPALDALPTLRAVSSTKNVVAAASTSKELAAAGGGAWHAFEASNEFTRQGVLGDAASGAWRLTDANGEYALCATYPSELVVPAAASGTHTHRTPP